MDTQQAWQAVGDIARRRREHLGLGQADLADYGGPKVTAVGKIERAAQDNFPTRTQHQLEKALGWKPGTVRQALEAASSSWWESQREEDETSLIEDNIPDLSGTLARADRATRASKLSDDELLAELTYRMERYAALTSAEEGDLRGNTTPMTPVERILLDRIGEAGDNETIGGLRRRLDVVAGAGVRVSPARVDVAEVRRSHQHEVDELAHRRRAEIAERIAAGDIPAAARTDDE